MAEHVCPWWLGYWLASPLRKLINNPDKILGPYVRDDMTVLEVGPGMGFFSLPIARMIGAGGKLVCVDLQQKMLDGLKKRAEKAGLSGRIEARLCSADSLKISDLAGKCDFVLLYAVAHEVPDRNRLFSEISSAMRAGARLLFSEPKGRITEEGFTGSLEFASRNGLTLSEREGYSAVLTKK